MSSVFLLRGNENKKMRQVKVTFLFPRSSNLIMVSLIKPNSVPIPSTLRKKKKKMQTTLFPILSPRDLGFLFGVPGLEGGGNGLRQADKGQTTRFWS